MKMTEKIFQLKRRAQLIIVLALLAFGKTASSQCTSEISYTEFPQGCGSLFSFFVSATPTTDSIVFDYGNGNTFTTNGISGQSFYFGGTYTVQVIAFHTNGCSSTSTQTINVEPDFTVDILNDSVACAGDIYLSASVSGGSGNYEYQWFFDGLPFTGDDLPNPTVSGITEVTEVALYVTDVTGGCQVADTAFVYPNVALTQTYELCEDSVWFDAPPFSQTYSWTYTNPQGGSLPLTIFAGGNVAYATEIGTYTCSTYTSGCNVVTHEFYVVECAANCTSSITASYQPDGCGGWMNFVPVFSSPYDSLYFDFGNGNTQTITGTSAQQYYNVGEYEVTLIVYHSNGCVSESIETINIEPELTLEIWNDSVACAGNLFLSANITGGSGNYEYQWFFDGLPFTGDDLPNPTVSGITEVTEVALYLTDLTSGCQVADTAFVYPNVMLIETYELCGNSVLFDAPPFSQTYSWTFEDEQGNVTSLSETGPLMEATEIGTYICVTYTSGCNIVDHIFYVIECSNSCFGIISSNITYVGCGAMVNFDLDASSGIDSVFWYMDGNLIGTDQGQGPEISLSPGTYMVIAESYFNNGCSIGSTYELTVIGSLVAELFEDTIACNGLLGLSVEVGGGSGNYEFQWEPASIISEPNIQYPFMTVSEDTWVTITVEDTTGCVATDSMFVYANEAINEVIELCNNSVVLTVPAGSLLYNWIYTDEFGNTTQLTGQGNSIETDNLGVFSCVTYYSGCNEVVHLFTIVECAGDGDVWPGDANSDLIVTNADALWVGLGFSQTGPIRTNASNAWVGQPADDWIFNFSQNNVNLKHADCNGNGIINFDDTLAISLNYGLTHNKVDAELLGGEPEIWVQAEPDTAGLEEAIDVYIHMGKSDVMVDSIHGISFSIVWAENFTMPNVASLDYSNSVFGTPGDDLLTFEKAFLSEGRIDVALSRINAVNIDGYGELVHLRIVTIDNLSGYGSIPISVENVTAITSSESEVTFSLIPDTVYIDPTRTDVLQLTAESRELEVFPNPTTGKFTVTNGDEQATFQVIDSRGRSVIRGNANGNSRFEIDLSGMDSGMYHLQVISSNSVRYSKIKLVR